MNIKVLQKWRRRRAAARSLRIIEDDESQMNRAQLLELAKDEDALEIAADYETVWAMAGDLAGEERIAEELAECDRLIADRKPARPWLQRPPVWAAASILLLLGGLLFTYQLQPVRYTTEIGEQRLVVLDDGTRITLNTATEVAVRYSSGRRRVVLHSGEAYFDVARDPQRPFWVDAPGGRAQALGTEFSIRLNNAAATVTVIEGLVAVTGTDGEAARSPQLKAGESLTLLPDGTLTPIETADIAPIRYWREGKIYFDNQRLDTSVAEFNRYLERKLVIGNRELNDLHIGGVFQAGDLDAFLFALDEAFDIEAVESPNAIVLVYR